MELSNYLASKKLKTTPQRVDLFNLFKQNNNPMSFDFIQKQISNFDRRTQYPDDLHGLQTEFRDRLPERNRRTYSQVMLI